MAKFSKLMITTAAAAVLSLAGTAAQASPTYTTGSFSMSFFTSTTSDLLTTTAFTLDGPIDAGSGQNDFSGAPIPDPISSPAAVDFSTGAGFDWTDAAIGTFTPAFSAELGSTDHPFASVTFGVEGSFVLGSYWANAGQVLDAVETWTCSQTGPDTSGEAISCAGTFNAPATIIPTNVPEPFTLSLFGAGLLGAAGLRRRLRKS